MNRVICLVLLGLSLAACNARGGLRQVNSYRTLQWEGYHLSRVVVLPFYDEVRGAQTDASGPLTSAFVREMRKKSPFEVVELSREIAREVRANNPFKHGQYPIDSLIALGRRYRSDAIVFGTVTALRHYVPQALGVRVEMVSVDTGETLWWADAMYDAADVDTENTVKRYWDTVAAHHTATDESRTVLTSPSLFAGFVAAQCVDSLWKKE